MAGYMASIVQSRAGGQGLYLRSRYNLGRSSEVELLKSRSGKKSKSVFYFFAHLRETGFSFSYAKVPALLGANGPSNEIDRVSKFDNSLSFGAKQNSLRQIFFKL